MSNLGERESERVPVMPFIREFPKTQLNRFPRMIINREM